MRRPDAKSSNGQAGEGGPRDAGHEDGHQRQCQSAGEKGNSHMPVPVVGALGHSSHHLQSSTIVNVHAVR